MIVDENDIQFQELTDTQFEELCFDILIRTGYHSVIWRQGGGDSGRDLEACFSVTHPIVGQYDERWFIECKNYASGISNSVLESKVAWAKAERPDHLLIITSSYLTNPTREWLKKICQDAPFRYHVLEGKHLKKVLLQFPDLVARYFLESGEELLQKCMQQWATSGILPEAASLWTLTHSIDTRRLTFEEMTFLWAVSCIRESEISRWCSEHDKEIFSFDFLIQDLVQNSNSASPLLVKDNLRGFECQITRHTALGPDMHLASIDIRMKRTEDTASEYGLYSSKLDPKGDGLDTGLEAIIIAQKSSIVARVRFLSENAKDHHQKLEIMFSSLGNSSQQGN